MQPRLQLKDEKGSNVEQEVTRNEDSAEKLGLFARIALFYRQVVSELKRVVWPTREQLTTYTSVVLVFVTFIIAVVSIFDLGLTKLVFWVFG
jgi:preprotein translocase subunit SecE